MRIIKALTIMALAGLTSTECFCQDVAPFDIGKPATFKCAGDANHSGWKGGIGMAFGMPATKIPDVSELGYEVIWGNERPEAASALDIAMFRYWNGIVEVSLKDSQAGYDFSGMADKDEAARLAFDEWAWGKYGVKGLSKYADVKYYPQGAYGDVKGTMDLSSDNPLTNAVVDTYVRWFKENGIKHGGIGIDNFATLNGNFLSMLRRGFSHRGLGIAINCLPERLKASPHVSYLDVAGAEGFPFPVDYAREIRAKGFKGIFCEFIMQHMSSAELSAYLKAKSFYGIVFFGYTDGGRAAGSQYSFYASRPDVYNHHRWVFRKYVPISRALFRACGQVDPYAKLKSAPVATASKGKAEKEAWDDGTGAIYEKGQLSADISKITGMMSSTPGVAFRFGDKIENGIYYFISSPKSETLSCDVQKLKLGPDTRVFDEFNERMIESSLTDSELMFSSSEGPSVVQLGTKPSIARNLVARMESALVEQDRQKSMEDAVKFDPMLKIWAPFCQGWTPDQEVAKSGKASMKTLGGRYNNVSEKWKYHNRQGGAQFVDLNQREVAPITLKAWSKADAVPSSPFTAIDKRREHFYCREGNIYAMHLYLDYQDGSWPEIHTVAFSAGTHDWEERVITVNPKKPVKTAMALLEFHQPSGNAWFDDISLVQGADGVNVLAYAGFENADIDSVRKEYASRLTVLRALIGKAGDAASIGDIKKEAVSIESWLVKSGAASMFGRELRDLRDIAHLADVALNVLAAK